MVHEKCVLVLSSAGVGVTARGGFATERGCRGLSGMAGTVADLCRTVWGLCGTVWDCAGLSGLGGTV